MLLLFIILCDSSNNSKYFLASSTVFFPSSNAFFSGNPWVKALFQSILNTLNIWALNILLSTPVNVLISKLTICSFVKSSIEECPSNSLP